MAVIGLRATNSDHVKSLARAQNAVAVATEAAAVAGELETAAATAAASTTATWAARDVGQQLLSAGGGRSMALWEQQKEKASLRKSKA